MTYILYLLPAARHGALAAITAGEMADLRCGAFGR